MRCDEFDFILIFIFSQNNSIIIKRIRIKINIEF